MDARPRIGSQVDHDQRHYTFSRTSGLPVGYFDRTERAGGIAVAIVFAVAVVLFVIGAFAP